jgi:hypothetical protein
VFFLLSFPSQLSKLAVKTQQVTPTPREGNPRQYFLLPVAPPILRSKE